MGFQEHWFTAASGWDEQAIIECLQLIAGNPQCAHLYLRDLVRDQVALRDEARREICDAFGKSWAYPMTDRQSWVQAFEEGRRAEAKHRGWEGLYPKKF